MTANQIIQLLNLKPHPEGGHYGETFRDGAGAGRRAASTAIYFLLMRGERSHWHRVDAAEVWHYYAGAPLKLEIAETDEGPIRGLRLGIDFSAGEQPQGRGAAPCVASRREPRRLDAGRLHGGAGLRIRRLRIGAAGVGTATLTRTMPSAPRKWR